MNESISILLGPHKKADGSSVVVIGGTEAVVGCVGPIETRSSNLVVEGQLEVSFKSEISIDQQEEAQVALIIQQSLGQTIRLTQRTVTSLSVRVLADEGNGFTAAFLASVAALIDAGISMIDIPIAVECFIDRDGDLVFGASDQRKDPSLCRFLLVFLSSSESPITIIMNGRCPRAKLRDVFQKASLRAQEYREALLHSIKSHIESNRDLCF